MVYQRSHNRIIVAGGVNAETGAMFTETWAYDLGSNRWTNLNPSAGYLPSREPGMAADPVTGRIVMFGGSDVNYNGTNHDQTWIYDPAANTWSRVTPPTGSPPARAAAPAMATDTRNGVVVMYGGIGSCTPSTYPFCADVWAFRFPDNSWTLLIGVAPQGGRDHNQFGFDPISGLFALFGGHGNFPGTYVNDTWTFDYPPRTWRNMNPAAQLPEARDHGKLAYAGSGTMLLFGGRCFGCSAPLPGTWLYDVARNTWSLLALSEPPARMDHAMAYHELNNAVVMFGGSDGDTWIFQIMSDLIPSVPANLLLE